MEIKNSIYLLVVLFGLDELIYEKYSKSHLTSLVSSLTLSKMTCSETSFILD